MDKKVALRSLIKHSFFLAEEVKIQLLGKIDSLSDEEIDVLGKFLANEKRASIKESHNLEKAYDEVIKKLK